MILLTRLNGPVFGVNPDLIERAEATPDTVLTLADGKKHVVTETLAELVELICDYRASVIARAAHFDPFAGPLVVDGSHRHGTDRLNSSAASAGGQAAHGAHGTADVLPLHRKES